MKKKNMRQHKTIFILGVILSVLLSQKSAGQEKNLSKEEAIQIALAQNFGIKVAGNNQHVAENNADVLNSGYLPTIFGQGFANYDVDDTETVRDDGEGFTLNNAESESYNASINLEYTLFDGLGRLYNFKRLKEQFGLSKLEARETIENTVLQLSSVYYEVSRITENVEILEETLEVSQERVLRAQYRFDYGQTTNLEVLNAKVDVTSDSINLMNTRQSLRNTKRDLRVVMGSELNIDFVADTIIEFIPELILKTYLDSALVNNVRILQSESNIRLGDYDIKTSKARFLPAIGLVGSYGWNKNVSPASAFFGGSTRTNMGLGAGLTLRWDLFNGGSKIIETKNFKIALENQQILRDQVTLEVQRDIANALGNYNNLIQVFEIQEQNVITNKNNFDRSEERLKLGQISSIEFRQAQINLINAQTNKNLAKYDAKLAELQLLQQVGQLLNLEL